MTTQDIRPARGTENGPLALLALCVLLSSLGTSIANVALPALAQAFAAPFGQVQGVVVAYLAALTAGTLVAGWLGDALGLRRVLLGGLAVFGLSAMVGGLVRDLPVLIALRAAQGAGAAALMTLALALARQGASRERLGRALGLLGTMSAVGTALGPSLGGVVLALFGWRGVFAVQALPVLLALGGAVGLLPPDGPVQPLARPGWPGRETLRQASGYGVALVVGVVMMATLVIVPFYLGLGLGLAPAQVGFAMAVGPVLSILSGVPSGRAVDRWGASAVLGAGLVLMAGGAGLLALLPQVFGGAGYLAAVAVLTPGYQLVQAANGVQALADVPPARRGMVSGLLSLARNTGLMLGAAVMGAVFAALAGARDVRLAEPAALATAFAGTMALCAALLVVVLALVVRRRRG